ncbi:MAG: bifunctional ornithine acetyltransferase/N-acetylglutamate synthase, partial [Clostridium sp.]|nr:bifunctional ornithine acetyltransferase/N-acetylglutamate synthase [Clostridium sp.]
MNIIEGGVTAAKGFEAAGVEAAIKYQNRKDMALIYSETPCIAAGVFTSNMVKAAPVLWDREIVAHSPAVHAVVVNAGVANACTGHEGYECCKKTAKAAADCLQIPEDSVLVASTGVIGTQIPVEKIAAGVKKLTEAKKDTIEAGKQAAEATMTTDT